MKNVNVVAAIIIRTDENSKKNVFATQRGYGDFKDGWEFPGGKIEEGESPESALAREIKEELATEIQVGEYIDTIEYDYPKFHLSMRCYACTILSGKLELLEHENAKWLTKETLNSVDWLPADILILDKVKNLL
jgi:8-oxo-dGTP diphosphatase